MEAFARVIILGLLSLDECHWGAWQEQLPKVRAQSRHGGGVKLRDAGLVNLELPADLFHRHLFPVIEPNDFPLALRKPSHEAV